MSVKDLLPKDKFDDGNLEKIGKLSDEELSTIIYDLFKWLQDYNWPVSKPILRILIGRQDLVFPYIAEVLNGNDDMWIYWILELLIPNLRKEYQSILRTDIEKLATQTETNEDTIEIVQKAKKCLNECYEKE